MTNTPTPITDIRTRALAAHQAYTKQMEAEQAARREEERKDNIRTMRALAVKYLELRPQDAYQVIPDDNDGEEFTVDGLTFREVGRRLQVCLTDAIAEFNWFDVDGLRSLGGLLTDRKPTRPSDWTTLVTEDDDDACKVMLHADADAFLASADGAGWHKYEESGA